MKKMNLHTQTKNQHGVMTLDDFCCKIKGRIYADSITLPLKTKCPPQENHHSGSIPFGGTKEIWSTMDVAAFALGARITLNGVKSNREPNVRQASKYSRVT